MRRYKNVIRARRVWRYIFSALRESVKWTDRINIVFGGFNKYKERKVFSCLQTLQASIGLTIFRISLQKINVLMIKHDVKNYRLSYQLPILGKVLEKIVFDQ